MEGNLEKKLSELSLNLDNEFQIELIINYSMEKEQLQEQNEINRTGSAVVDMLAEVEGFEKLDLKR